MIRNQKKDLPLPIKLIKISKKVPKNTNSHKALTSADIQKNNNPVFVRMKKMGPTALVSYKAYCLIQRDHLRLMISQSKNEMDILEQFLLEAVNINDFSDSKNDLNL